MARDAIEYYLEMMGNCTNDDDDGCVVAARSFLSCPPFCVDVFFSVESAAARGGSSSSQWFLYRNVLCWICFCLHNDDGVFNCQTFVAFCSFHRCHFKTRVAHLTFFLLDLALFVWV